MMRIRQITDQHSANILLSPQQPRSISLVVRRVRETTDDSFKMDRVTQELLHGVVRDMHELMGDSSTRNEQACGRVYKVSSVTRPPASKPCIGGWMEQNSPIYPHAHTRLLLHIHR